MAKIVLTCGKLFDGAGEVLREHAEILIEGDAVADIFEAVGRPEDARVIYLSDRTVTPGFIDTHVHLCLDGLNLKRQALQCASVKALSGPHLA